MKGVTLANFRRYVKPGATKDDLRGITHAQLSTVYRRFYWDAVHGAELPHGVDLCRLRLRCEQRAGQSGQVPAGRRRCRAGW
nr:glycosyl hydrolase 108 family protein [Aminobacter sp. SS-2016]